MDMDNRIMCVTEFGITLNLNNQIANANVYTVLQSSFTRKKFGESID